MLDFKNIIIENSPINPIQIIPTTNIYVGKRKTYKKYMRYIKKKPIAPAVIITCGKYFIEV